MKHLQKKWLKKLLGCDIKISSIYILSVFVYSDHNHLNNAALSPLGPAMALSHPHNNLGIGFNKYTSLKATGEYTYTYTHTLTHTNRVTEATTTMYY